MARTIGVDPGAAAVKVVEIDGSYRKTRLLRVHVQPEDSGLPRAGVVAEATRAAIDAGMRGEVRLGHPCREAVLRTLDLPFKGRDAIRRVVKAEVEGEIHGYVVDDMVVDFHEIGGAAEGSSRVLVAAVPKEGLRAQLGALQAVAVDPATVDLDTMALWRAAHWAGAFGATGTDEAGGAYTAVVDVGQRSVKVLLVQGEQLVDMRTLRLGDGSIAEEIAMRHGIGVAQAQEVVLRCLASGAAQRIEVVEALPATVGAEDAAEAPAPGKSRIETVEPDEIEAARAALLQRLQRELFRYLASSGRSGFRAVWLTGGGSRLEGVPAVVGEVFGVAPTTLNVLDNLQHDLPPEQAAELGPRLAAAVGLALAEFGGPAGMDLRKEDLALTRGFERMKFPLTIALMVGLLALFVYGNRRAAELYNLELEIGKTFEGQKSNETRFFGQVDQVLVGNWWKDPRNFLYDQGKGRSYRYAELVKELSETPVHRRVQLLRDKLRLVAEQKQKESGVYEEVSLESGFAVLVRFSEMIRSVEAQLGRFLVTRIELQMSGSKHFLKFVVAFRGSDFRGRSSALQAAIENEIAKSDSPFRANDKDKLLDEELFRGGGDGAYFTVTMAIKDSFPPFGPGR